MGEWFVRSTSRRQLVLTPRQRLGGRLVLVERFDRFEEGGRAHGTHGCRSFVYIYGALAGGAEGS